VDRQIDVRRIEVSEKLVANRKADFVQHVRDRKQLPHDVYRKIRSPSDATQFCDATPKFACHNCE
jgi:hypothetical protein